MNVNCGAARSWAPDQEVNVLARWVFMSGLATGLSLAASMAHATIPLPATPDWESTAQGRYGTGLGVGDFNGDGWMDFVVSNGNDMARQSVGVYLNHGDGSFPSTPDWTSTDIDYLGHLDLADVDGDGILDLAVSVYIGASGFSTPGRVKLYRGLGDGRFSDTPAWQSADTFYCFSLAFGDMDMDGDPDLACATGDDYYNHPERRRIYRNVGGALETAPVWQSTESEYSLDVTWADFNGDGALDLAFAGTSCPNRIYFATGGGIAPTAGWSSSDASIYANTAAAGDYDGDGWIDLAIADNDQLGGGGRFKLYRNLGTGTLGTQPIWQSSYGGYGSHVSWIDLDEDGDLDLATGEWWGPVRIYENAAGVLGTAPAYTSATASVIENEVWEDLDNDGLQEGRIAEWDGDGSRKLFVLPERPARRLLSVAVDGVSLPVGSVRLDPDDGWIVLPDAPSAGAEVRCTFVTSADLDLLLSNWDSTEGEYLFYNTRNPSGLLAYQPGMDLRIEFGPNPSWSAVRFEALGAAGATEGVFELFDAQGRSVRQIPVPGSRFEWDGRNDGGRLVTPGVYLGRLRAADGRLAFVRVLRR